MSVVRFGISLDGELLGRFDSLIEGKGYKNRSEAIRDLIRDSLVKEAWDTDSDDMAGTVTLVYSHHTRELQDTLTELQHEYHRNILSSMHIHLDAHNCLEVLVVRGNGKTIKTLSDRLIGTKGVKHGRLTVTTTGKDLK